MSALNKDLNVVVLMGGWSSEREVSLMSGKGVANALLERGWSQVTEVDMDRNVAQVLAGIRPDVVFNALRLSVVDRNLIRVALDFLMVRLLANSQRPDRPPVRCIGVARHACGVQSTVLRGTDRLLWRSHLV